MHSHLVTVEVRVIGGTNERVNADSGSLNQHGLESLDGETVQGRSTVQHDRVSFGHLFEDVPDFCRLAIDHLLGTTHSVAVTEVFESADDKWLKQGECHLLR